MNYSFCGLYCAVYITHLYILISLISIHIKTKRDCIKTIATNENVYLKIGTMYL